MKKTISHYTVLTCLILLIISQVNILIWMSVPIKDSALSVNTDYSVMYYLKFTTTYFIYLLFGVIGFVLLILRNKRGMFFATLFVLYLLINNIFIVKSNWIYFAQWAMFIIFFLTNLNFKFYKYYGLNKSELVSYFSIIFLICLIEFVPLIFSRLSM